jgi:hypothetical protein
MNKIIVLASVLAIVGCGKAAYSDDHPKVTVTDRTRECTRTYVYGETPPAWTCKETIISPVEVDVQQVTTPTPAPTAAPQQQQQQKQSPKLYKCKCGEYKSPKNRQELVCTLEDLKDSAKQCHIVY